MSDRRTIRVFKGVDAKTFCAAVERIAVDYGGAIAWNVTPAHHDSDFRTSHNHDVHTVYMPYLSGADYLFCEAVGTRLSVPWLELRVQESSHWDYSLYRGSENLDNFSTLPEYWDDDQARVASQRGNPPLLAAAWGVALPKIDNYLKQWGYVLNDDDGLYDTILCGKAYPNDEFEYGDFWQIYDFLRALGGLDPCDTDVTGSQHCLKCPKPDAYEKAS
jgi:hypothetical protein